MGVIDEQARSRRVLTHSKSRTPKLVDGWPIAAEGRNGDIQYRRIATGIVTFLKDKNIWVKLGASNGAASDSTQAAEEATSDVGGTVMIGGGGSTTSQSQLLITSQLTISGENPMVGGTTTINVNGNDGAFDATKMQTGDVTSGLLNIPASDTVSSAVAQIDTILAKLAPPKPPNLSAVSGTLSIGTTYSGKAEGTSTIRTTVTEDTTPKFIVAPNNDASTGLDGFFDGSGGTLIGEFAQNGSNYTGSGTVTITAQGSSTQTGADDGLTSTTSGVKIEVTGDFDPWYGTDGKSNFWEALDAEASFSTLTSGDRSTVGMRMRLTHSTTGSCTSNYFYFDQAPTPSVTNMVNANLTSRPSEPGDVRERHGVKAFDGGGTFTVGYTVGGICSKFYNSSKIGQSKILGWNNSYTNDNASSAPSENDTPTLSRAFSRSGAQHSGKSGFTAVNFTIYGKAYNWKNATATDSYSLTDVYVDSYSDKSNRKNAGKTQYPAYGSNTTTQYGSSTFQMTTVLGTANFFELMQFGNYIQWPNKDFSWVNHPTQDQADADINYDTNIASSSGTNIGGSYYRWFCKKATGVLSASSGFTITINGDSGLSGSPHDPNIKVYAIVVSGSTELTTWMDCNTSPGYQPGNPDPGTVADGDLCVLDASSAKDSKVCTFGTATYTGDLYIRIGLKDGSDKFTDISISGT